MKNIVAVVLVVAVLGSMAWVMWTFKWWIIGGCAVVTLIEMAYQRITGRESRLYQWAKKQ